MLNTKKFKRRLFKIYLKITFIYSGVTGRVSYTFSSEQIIFTTRESEDEWYNSFKKQHSQVLSLSWKFIFLKLISYHVRRFNKYRYQSSKCFKLIRNSHFQFILLFKCLSLWNSITCPHDFNKNTHYQIGINWYFYTAQKDQLQDVFLIAVISFR